MYTLEEVARKLSDKFGEKSEDKFSGLLVALSVRDLLYMIEEHERSIEKDKSDLKEVINCCPHSLVEEGSCVLCLSKV